MSPEHMPKLLFLAQMVRELLPDYTVKTPDQFGAGNIMDQVMASCDAAELVIADTTENNPNVLYEIGVLDSLGRLCIPVKLAPDKTRKKTKGKSTKDLPPFDRAAYRCFYLDLKNSTKAKEQLQDAIQKSFDEQRVGKPEGNPVTNYYRAPVVEISPAFGIALGYCENFVKNLVRNLAERAGDRFRPILYGNSKEEKEMTQLDNNLREEIKLDIVIPSRLNYADHRAIATNLVAAGLLKNAVIKMDFTVDARSLPLYMWPDRSALVDIPTAMNVMRKSIKRRLGGREKIDDRSLEWCNLEDEEIARFTQQVELNIYDPDQESNLRTHTRVRTWKETSLKKAKRL
jgi:hypothetical protein